ncbi:MAG: RsmB/NOP family class I SAM-dependent RNA methyltransferase [Bacteroidota bacterium]
MPLPDLFLDRFRDIVPSDRLEDVLATFETPAETAFRACSLVASEADALARLSAEGVPFAPVDGIPGGYRAPDRAALLASGPYTDGWLYVQNASSQLPPHLLAPEPGERVLDLCAAPGSKTGQLAALMRDEGEIIAVEKVRGRYYKLRANVEAQGATCVVPWIGDGARVWQSETEAFDRVLLDAPCSTEGRFLASNPETTRYWSKRKIKEMRTKQRRLLFSAIMALRPGGTLVYSTCTFAPEENEATLGKALKTFGEAIEIVPAGLPGEGPVAASCVPGVAGWNGRAFPEAVRLARRVLPDGLLEGFFVARIVKHASTVR